MPEVSNFDNIDENAVLKEVWNILDVKAKTELTPEQIQSVNKLSTLAGVFGNNLLDEHLKDFMVLQKSKNRKSMSEFVEIFKSKNTEQDFRGGFFNKMMG